MLKKEETRWFECLKSFDQLNGREKQFIAVCDGPDARTARILFLDHVKHNWPSQWHSRYKDGFLQFEKNRKRFDLQKETIGAKRVYLFNVTIEILILWLRQTHEDRIIHSMNRMPAGDRVAADDLIRELAPFKVEDQALRRSPSHALLAALSVSELEALEELFEMPSGPLAVAPQVAA